jgi:opacity protein-like surface antigen
MRLLHAPSSLFALSLIAGAGVAAASSSGISYIGLRGSYAETESLVLRGTGDAEFDADTSAGFGATVLAGWVLDDALRVEAEAGYRINPMKAATIARDDTLAYLPGDSVALDGELQTVTAMVSLFYDLHIEGSMVLPWIGVGAGGVIADVSLRDPLAALDVSDSAWAPAFQVLAGATIPLVNGVSLSADYRYLRSADFDLISMAGDTQTTHLDQHSVEIGVQFHLQDL